MAGLRGNKVAERLLFPELEAAEAEMERKQGRSAELIAKRDEVLAVRFYYYTVFTTHMHDVKLEFLEREFFISKSTIGQLVSEDEYDRMLQKLRKMNPDVKWFRKEYDWLVWADAMPLSKKGREK